MNKLFIIGNGFDLAHDLKTHYSDFILWYFNKSIKSYNGTRTGSYGDELMNIVNDGYNIREFDSFESLIKEFNSRRKAFQTKSSLFEHLLTRLRDLNWVDVEIEYFRGLVDLMNNYEQLYKRSDLTAIKVLRKYNTKFILIKELLIEYLQTIKTGRYNETIKGHIKDELSRTSYKRVLFLVFNYTNIINQYIIMLGMNKSEVINIHGKLREVGNPIIFGYGDVMNEYCSKFEGFNLIEFTENMKSNWYSRTSNKRNLDRFIDEDNFNVSIMGHSCGISDRDLLTNIFCDSNCKEIRIFYKDVNDYNEKTQRILSLFSKDLRMRKGNLIEPFAESKSLT